MSQAPAEEKPKYPVMRVVMQVAVPHPTLPRVELASTEEFYTLVEHDKVTPSKLLYVMSGQLKAMAKSVRETKFSGAIIKP